MQTYLLDYEAIAKRASSASVVAIGESTHGTHEFFKFKVDVFERLISKYNFNVIFLESIDDHCAAINSYISTGEGHLEKLVGKLSYFYRTYEIVELIKWLRENYKDYPVSFIGLDERKYVADYAAHYDIAKQNKRDERMASVIKHQITSHPKTKALVWAHNTHVAAYIDHPEFNKPNGTRPISMGETLRGWYNQNYFCVGLLFGKGYFNAALIDENGNTDNSKLQALFAPETSAYFWEYLIGQHFNYPVFLSAADYTVFADAATTKYVRAIGWGLKLSEIHDRSNVKYITITKAFDAIAYFPNATPGKLL